jgi:hypothetical protein
MPLNLYVYYRCRASDDAAVRKALSALAGSLSSAGLPCPSVLRRPDLRDGERTWMEVYASIEEPRVEAFVSVLDAQVTACGLVPLLRSARHLERFEAL